VIVCLCRSVSDSDIQAAVASGAKTIADVTSFCGAGGGCGACRSDITALIKKSEVGPVKTTTLLRSERLLPVLETQLGCG